ncbi:MAG: hypothetical protein AVDCRST_MAG49-4519 [uncultured Thermomicrobiales bacterium]|uniref:Polymerase/histidinol phosphatase N-terminal domain-containing protein n=1 Tax=uncultured Thermomicrobiales bacterium TaxID=1645740 RepID=A0A6J4VI10_9BACT|nr:MAG: hypothetical protein AVDCRST_MAG49-4519 [uncultured Thermomicrobiales bacterium]
MSAAGDDDRGHLPEPDVVLEGRFAADHERRYAHVPFTVPPGLSQIHVRYDYSHRIASDPQLRGGNTLDIGLFDERGIEAGGPGFRGWSGSAKRAFTVGRDWSTPPYKPGPINAGEWHALLGPYKVAPDGLAYRVEVWFDPGLTDRPPDVRLRSPRRPDLPPPAEPGWVRADLHAHTLYSDGDAWPAELLVAAAEAGLDVLGITDHNAAVSPVAPDGADGTLPLLVPGVEVTTYGGHWNAWGGRGGWIEFREPEGTAVQAAVDGAVAGGAFVSVNHPKPFGPPWAYPEVTGFHAVEVWNGAWLGLNAIALAHWERLLRAGQRPIALGGSDTHYLHAARDGRVSGPLGVARLGHPTTWVGLRPGAPPTAPAVLAEIRAGRCFVSASPAGPQLYLVRATDGAQPDGEVGPVSVRAVGGRGATLSLIGRDGCLAASPVPGDDWAATVAVPPGTPYVRAQLTDATGGVLALTNPVWHDTPQTL